MLAKVYSNEYNKTTAKRRKICIKIQRNAYLREDTRRMETIILRGEYIKLGQALKAAGRSKRSDTGRSGHGKWRDRYTPRT